MSIYVTADDPQAMIETPPVSVNAAMWVSVVLSSSDVAWLFGACGQRLASDLGITEADFYAEFAKRAASDLDCQVLR